MKQIKGGCLTKKKDVYLPLHELLTKVQDPSKIVEVKAPVNTSSVKVPVTSRVSPP